jgi:hypothetical protein
MGEMRYKREAAKGSATGSIKAKDIIAGDITAGSVEADKITADRIKAKNIRAKYISVRRRRKRPKSNPDENVEHTIGQDEHVQLRQMQTSNLDQNKEHTIDQNQHQSDHRSSTNQHEIEPPLPTPTIPPRLAGLLKAKLIRSKHIETNYMKAKKIKAHIIHASKVQTDSINVRKKGSDITKSVVKIPHGEFNLDRISKPNKRTDNTKSTVQIPHGESSADLVSKLDTSEGNQAFIRNRVSKPDTLEGKQAFIRTKGRRKSSKRKSKRRKRPRQKIDRRPPSPTLPPGIVNVNLPVKTGKTGWDLKKRLDLPPFITVEDMEKADRLKSMVTNLQFLGLSDDYIKGLQTERQRNQGHQSMTVSRSFFDPNRFVLAHSPKSRRLS